MTTAVRIEVSAICPQCGQSYQVRWVGQKFCSPLCARRSRRITQTRECPCGRAFIPRRPGHTYCSRECVVEWGRPVRLKLCPHCGVEFRLGPPTQRFCSRRCCLAARRKRRTRICGFCGEAFGFIDGRRRFCSRRCALLGKKQPSRDSTYNWKGGRTETNGYVRSRAPGHPRASKAGHYVLEHILVMEKALGRFLLPNERVHHKNGRRDDNRPENLELWRMKDPPGVRSSDYHCPGCTCDRGSPSDPNSDIKEHV
jgi:HNH endonuclease